MSAVDMFFVWGRSLLDAFWNVYNFCANTDLKQYLVSGVSNLIEAVVGLLDWLSIGDAVIEEAVYYGVSHIFRGMSSFTLFDLLFSRAGIIAFFSLSLFVLVKRAVF
jgi:hypothetical protein